MSYSVVLPASDSHTYVIAGIMLRAADYRQIMCWATALEKTPEDIIRILQCTSVQGVGLTVVDGAIKTLVWDGAALPLEDFDWQPGLGLDTLVITRRVPCLKTAHLLPSLRCLKVADCGLSALDLSAFPNLRQLDCRGNQLVQLALDGVPQLEELLCCGNLLAGLDLSRVPALRALNCSKNRQLGIHLADVLGLRRFYCDLSQLKVSAESVVAAA